MRHTRNLGHWFGLLRGQFFVFKIRRLIQLEDRIAEKVRILATVPHLFHPKAVNRIKKHVAKLKSMKNA